MVTRDQLIAALRAVVGIPRPLDADPEMGLTCPWCYATGAYDDADVEDKPGCAYMVARSLLDQIAFEEADDGEA